MGHCNRNKVILSEFECVYQHLVHYVLGLLGETVNSCMHARGEGWAGGWRVETRRATDPTSHHYSIKVPCFFFLQKQENRCRLSLIIPPRVFFKARGCGGSSSLNPKQERESRIQTKLAQKPNKGNKVRLNKTLKGTLTPYRAVHDVVFNIQQSGRSDCVNNDQRRNCTELKTPIFSPTVSAPG